MTVSCEEARRTIPWLLDDEIEPAQMLELEEHLNDCAGCREVLERENALRETVRRAVRVTAPPVLRRSIREVLDRERRRRNPWMQMWPAAAAAAILLALIWKGAAPTGVLPELDEAAQRHARDLPLDVVAADVGPVQRYFNGKLPFSVQLPRLTKKEPVQQLGGRITQLHNREAAYVRYEMPRGRMALFVYQDPGSAVSEVTDGYLVGQQRMVVQRVRGYTVARWRSSGLVYSVVTDLPPQEIPSVLDLAPRR